MTIGRWQPPMADWVKVNVDGSVSRNNPKASVGGVVRGPSGGWLVGFKMVLAKGFRCVELKSDNAMLIETIHNGLVTVSSVVEVR
ncbi:hypothetical protein Golob_014369 [Gossypium lobatum]|uniref:RNase H type-1 domain-containing protein n=1 Tax=Gossypium lobatum TaxID=34289 RepID=A0A7J8LY21_9ROSI|nr:hypothetical protein [Gossypium lobatum]